MLMLLHLHLLKLLRMLLLRLQLCRIEMLKSTALGLGPRCRSGQPLSRSSVLIVRLELGIHLIVVARRKMSLLRHVICCLWMFKPLQ